jgi:hypothetical protein
MLRTNTRQPQIALRAEKVQTGETSQPPRRIHVNRAIARIIQPTES